MNLIVAADVGCARDLLNGRDHDYEVTSREMPFDVRALNLSSVPRSKLAGVSTREVYSGLGTARDPTMKWRMDGTGRAHSSPSQARVRGRCHNENRSTGVHCEGFFSCLSVGS